MLRLTAQSARVPSAADNARQHALRCYIRHHRLSPQNMQQAPERLSCVRTPRVHAAVYEVCWSFYPQASQASQARRQLSMEAKQAALRRLTEDLRGGPRRWALASSGWVDASVTACLHPDSGCRYRSIQNCMSAPAVSVWAMKVINCQR